MAKHNPFYLQHQNKFGALPFDILKFLNFTMYTKNSKSANTSVTDTDVSIRLKNKNVYTAVRTIKTHKSRTLFWLHYRFGFGQSAGNNFIKNSEERHLLHSVGTESRISHKTERPPGISRNGMGLSRNLTTMSC